MNLEQSAKYLVEAMGGCWHERGELVDTSVEAFSVCLKCPKCNQDIWWPWFPTKSVNPNPSSWEFFGEVWEWAKKQGWWFDFYSESFIKEIEFRSWNDYEETGKWGVPIALVGPDFILRLAEFLEKERRK